MESWTNASSVAPVNFSNAVERAASVALIEDLSNRIMDSSGHMTESPSLDFLRSIASKNLRILHEQTVGLRWHPRGTELEQLISDALEYQALFGDRSPLIVNTTTALSPNGTRAEVWMTRAIQFLDLRHPNSRQETVSVLKWQYDVVRRRWEWCGYYSIRGPGARVYG
jgi:hypothetical protein